ncbi:hypothetical protein GPALN_012786 [Globodera pallida]|nr:hypothetical protein GPALN_012786 [Globodera pallida]
MPCNCQPIQPPPPFDVPPPPDPSLVFHLLSDDPPEAFEKLHTRHSCPLQKQPFLFRLPPGRFLPLAAIAFLLLLASFSITAFALWRRRRRRDGTGAELDGREWRRKSSETETKSGRKEATGGGGKKRWKTTKGKKRASSNLSGSCPKNGVLPSSLHRQPNFNINFPISSPSSDPDANFSYRSSTETVSSVPSLPHIAGSEWLFCQPAAASELDVKVGSNVLFHSSPSVAFDTPPRRPVALRLLPNRHLSPDFVWRSSAGCAGPPSNDLYEELAGTDGEIAEAPYKWRLTPSARRMPPPSSKPPPPPTDYPPDWPTSVAQPFANGSAETEMEKRLNHPSTAAGVDVKTRPRTSSDQMDKERESGYGTGRSGGGGRERNQRNGTTEENRSSSSTHPFSPLPHAHVHSQPYGSSTANRNRQIPIHPKPKDGSDKLRKGREGQIKTMTYL